MSSLRKRGLREALLQRRSRSEDGSGDGEVGCGRDSAAVSGVVRAVSVVCSIDYLLCKYLFTPSSA